MSTHLPGGASWYNTDFGRRTIPEETTSALACWVTVFEISFKILVNQTSSNSHQKALDQVLSKYNVPGTMSLDIKFKWLWSGWFNKRWLLDILSKKVSRTRARKVMPATPSHHQSLQIPLSVQTNHAISLFKTFQCHLSGIQKNSRYKSYKARMSFWFKKKKEGLCGW